MMENRADELEQFKSGINLAEYAEACGYTFDRQTSGRQCRIMRAGTEKIVITRAPDGHDVYFNVRDERDCGSIIDFVQRRQGLTLGQVRQELRPWIGVKARPTVRSRQRRPEAERITRPETIPQDREALLRAYHGLDAYRGDYLGAERKLSRATVDAFAPVIRQDPRGNVAFLHKDSDGAITGWELKNRGFTGFVAGGRKALAMHMPRGTHVQRVVIVESLIDGMSYCQMHGKEGDCYVSLAGTMSEAQKQQLRDLLQRVPAVVIAVDRDEQGDKYAAMIRQARPDAKRELPNYGKDWNDELRQPVSRSVGMSM